MLIENPEAFKSWLVKTLAPMWVNIWRAVISEASASGREGDWSFLNIDSESFLFVNIRIFDGEMLTSIFNPVWFTLSKPGTSKLFFFSSSSSSVDGQTSTCWRLQTMSGSWQHLWSVDVLCQQSQCRNDCRHVPRSSRKGCDTLSPVKVEYQTVEVFHG